MVFLIDKINIYNYRFSVFKLDHRNPHKQHDPPLIAIL